MKKGRYGVVHGSIEVHFNPYHVLIETGSLDDLTEEELIKKVTHSLRRFATYKIPKNEIPMELDC